jgi:hypothetical protein
LTVVLCHGTSQPFLAADDAVERLPVTAKEIDDNLRTDWYGLYLKDKKIGYARAALERVGAGEKAVVRDSLSLTAKLVSAGTKEEMQVEQTMDFDSRAPYRFRGGAYRMRAGDSSAAITLVRTEKGYTAKHTAGGQERVEYLAGLDYTLADVFTPDVFLRKGPKAGDKILYREFSFEKLKVDRSDFKIVAVKNSLASGVSVKFFEVDIHSRLEDVTLRSRFDSTGRLLSGSIAIFEMRLEPEDQAKNIDYSQDLFVLGMVKTDRPIGDPRHVTRLVLEISGADGIVFPVGPYQAVVGKGSGVTLTLGRKYGRPVKATAREIEENLADSITYPVQHPRIKALAREAIKDAATPEAKVKRLVEFVHDYIKPAVVAARPNIHELVERKKGCCTEYALLFTNLARAAGIPAREANGLMYIGDDEKAFGGHAWNEVVLDGCWIPVDAAWGETEVDATHICFSNNGRGLKNVLASLGKLTFRVVEVERK